MANKKIDKAHSFDFNEWCEQQKKKKKALLGGRIFVVAIFWAIIIAYLVSPFSKSKIVSFEGNQSVISKDDVYNIGEFKKDSFWWSTNLKDVENKLLDYGNGKYILDVDLQYSINGINVKLEENIIVGKYLNANNNYVYVLRDGSTFVDDARLDTSQHYYDKKHLGLTKNIPTIEHSIVTSNSGNDFLEQLARLEQRDKLSSIEKADALSTVEQFKLTFSKEKVGIDHDLVVIISANSMVHALKEENFKLLLALVTDNANYYLSNDQYVAMYGPINVGSDEYGFVPYSKKD